MTNIVERPYPERRIVLIISEEEQSIEATNGDADRDTESQEAYPTGSMAVQVVSFALEAALLTPVPLSSSILGSILSKGKETAPDTSSHESSPGVIALRQKSAMKLLDFPPGHPIVGHAYVGHPLVPKQYIPSAVFHPTLFEEKVNELMTLLASLGASRVRVSCRKGYRDAYGAQAGLEGQVGQVGVGKLGAEAESVRQSQQSAVFEEHYRPTGEASVPDDLVWYGYEQSWQSLASRRLKYGTTKFLVSLQYEDDYGVNARLTAGLKVAGFKLGGHFSKFSSTQWDFEGEFA